MITLEGRIVSSGLEKIGLGAQETLRLHPDVIIAVGGGSAIDSAKAIREVALQIEPSYERPALIAIPTTSGTGTEVTSFSVVSVTARPRRR